MSPLRQLRRMDCGRSVHGVNADRLQAFRRGLRRRQCAPPRERLGSRRGGGRSRSRERQVDLGLEQESQIPLTDRTTSPILILGRRHAQLPRPCPCRAQSGPQGVAVLSPPCRMPPDLQYSRRNAPRTFSCMKGFLVSQARASSRDLLQWRKRLRCRVDLALMKMKASGQCG